MKKALLLCGALLAVSASIASAAGLNLSWSACGAGGTENKTFACTSNTGSNVLVASYVAPAGTVGVTGMEAVIDLQSASPTLPAWWQFKNVGTCRTTALSSLPAGAACDGDYWAGQASGGISAYITPYATAANRARLLIIYAVPGALAGPVDADVEYFGFTVTISNAKTAGGTGCAGCADPVCVVLNEIKLTQGVGIGDFRIQNPAARNYVSWQGGVVSGGCPAATPARNATWGSVKSLYR